MVPAAASVPALLDAPDDLEDLHGVGSELLGDLILNRLGALGEAGLVDVLDELDADLLELGQRFVLELDGLGRLRAPDLVGGGLDPLLLLGAEAGPRLVADPED